MVGFAQQLRDAGHAVHTPDLFDGRTFPDIHDGIAYVDSVGEETFAARATEIVAAYIQLEDLPSAIEFSERMYELWYRGSAKQASIYSIPSGQVPAMHFRIGYGSRPTSRTRRTR